GDSVRGFRIVGTEPALVEHYGASIADGAMFDAPMQAVLGSEAARATGLRAGASFAGTHGLAEGGGEHEAEPYRVTGVLAPTGSVVARLVLPPVESVWDVHEMHRAPPKPAPDTAPASENGHGEGGNGSSKPPAGAGGQPDGHAADADADRELTMILVR